MKGMERSDSSKPFDDVKPFAAPMDVITSDVLSNEEHNEWLDFTSDFTPKEEYFFTALLSVKLSEASY